MLQHTPPRRSPRLQGNINADAVTDDHPDQTQPESMLISVTNKTTTQTAGGNIKSGEQPITSRVVQPAPISSMELNGNPATTVSGHQQQTIG